MESLRKIANVSREIVERIDHRQTADAHGGHVIKDAHITANGEERSLTTTTIIITIHPITIIIITTPAAAAAPRAAAGKPKAARTMEEVWTLRKKKRKISC